MGLSTVSKVLRKIALTYDRWFRSQVNAGIKEGWLQSPQCAMDSVEAARVTWARLIEVLNGGGKNLPEQTA